MSLTESHPVICERTIAYGKQRWRVNSHNEWSVLMWGWWPDSNGYNGYPSWTWQEIEINRVPKEVKNAV